MKIPSVFCGGYFGVPAHKHAKIGSTPDGKGSLFLWQRYHKLIQCTALFTMHHLFLNTNPGTIGTERTQYAIRNCVLWSGDVLLLVILGKFIASQNNQCRIIHCSHERPLIIAK